jgi:hypothetical protein
MLTQLFEAPAVVADPATPENRQSLARRLLIGAIRRYEEACEEWSAVHESYPTLDHPRPPVGPDEMREWTRWRSLMLHADENFDNAELNLAERIHGLFTMLDPAGRCVPRDEAAYFVPRCVRHGGNAYVLAYSAYEYEKKTNIIAVYRDSMVVDA